MSNLFKKLITPPDGWGKKVSVRLSSKSKTPQAQHAAEVFYRASVDYKMKDTDILQLALECLGVVNGWIDAHETLEFAQLQRKYDDISPEERVANIIIDYLRENQQVTVLSELPEIKMKPRDGFIARNTPFDF